MSYKYDIALLERKVQHRRTSPTRTAASRSARGGGFEPSYTAQMAVDDSRIPARTGDSNYSD
ncbi:hypothetical protein [Azohydromonas australica]|uniref:hypothetical protein n=1 Tax=Azohydromonas australica TaxID=364039 RepID=UPI0003FBFBA8|nr:hypothetical protein [Azohydromonas australica]